MKRLDIRAIIAAKNPKLLRYLPGFAIRLFERLVCVEKVNYLLDNFSHHTPIGFIGATLKHVGVTYQLHGYEKLHSLERVIFASNHPLGGLDGLILAHGIAQQYPEMEPRLIVNDILMSIEPLHPLFVPVNKHGMQRSEYLLAQKELYNSQSSIITFPAGLCSRLVRGQIVDLPWKHSFIKSAIRSNRQIVPTYIVGRNSRFFYYTARLRKALGIKFNLEMLRLPHEMFSQGGKHLDIYFGEPIQIKNSGMSIQQAVEMVREKTYLLSKEHKRR